MSRYETIGLNLPEEPGPGSVVIGKTGRAYQNIKPESEHVGAWYAAGGMGIHHGGGGSPFAVLIIHEGPLKVVYRAENDETAKVIEGTQN